MLHDMNYKFVLSMPTFIRYIGLPSSARCFPMRARSATRSTEALRQANGWCDLDRVLNVDDIMSLEIRTFSPAGCLQGRLV